MDENAVRSALFWNAGGWFGTQLGCTLWLLVLGIVLLSKDSLSAGVCIAGFVVLNLCGAYLWHRREQVSAYAGFQWFLFAASLIIALVVLVLNKRGVSGSPTSGALVSTYLPPWVVVFAPALMLLFFLLERKAKRTQG